MAKKFPEVLYIGYETDERTKEEYFNTTDDPSFLSELDVDKKVARYVFEKIVTVSNKTTIKE